MQRGWGGWGANMGGMLLLLLLLLLKYYTKEKLLIAYFYNNENLFEVDLKCDLKEEPDL